MKTGKSLQPCWLVCIAIFLSFCSTNKTVQKDTSLFEDSNHELLIYIQQGTCLGKCPNYEAWFYTGKKMVYEGKANMPLIGKYEFLLSEELTKNLIFEAVKMNVKLVPDSLSTPPNKPVTRIWVVINGKLKKMVGWTESGNETFKKFTKLVSGEVRAMITEQEGRKTE